MDLQSGSHVENRRLLPAGDNSAIFRPLKMLKWTDWLRLTSKCLDLPIKRVNIEVHSYRREIRG